jgi:uncharacterized phage-associated protein
LLRILAFLFITRIKKIVQNNWGTRLNLFTGTGEKLFKEPIVAYKYGPVLEDIFRRYRVHGSSLIDYEEDAKFKLITEELTYTPSFLKVMSSEQGLEALLSIKHGLEKYGHLEAFDLVEKSHQASGPWKEAYIVGANRRITDDLIKERHHYVQ